MKPKLTFIHSLNNYTGSPHVLAILIKEFVRHGYEVELITSKGEGFLSDISGVNYRFTCYRWHTSTIVTALLLFMSQVQTFLMVLGLSKKNRIFYINTIIPFGAAWACFLKRAKYIYHVHENMQQAKPLYRFLRWTYGITNTKSIFVSKYLKRTASQCKNGTVVYNALTPQVAEKAYSSSDTKNVNRHSILMVSSLKSFKGIYEFIELARFMPKFHFKLILSSEEREVEGFIQKQSLSKNIRIYSIKKNLVPFYSGCKILLVLTRPREVIESFGMTVLEAMTFGVPAIVPPVGGPTELVIDGKSGYHIDVHNQEKIKNKITNLMEDPVLWQSLSEMARERSKLFNAQTMFNSIENYILR